MAALPRSSLVVTEGAGRRVSSRSAFSRGSGHMFVG